MRATSSRRDLSALVVGLEVGGALGGIVGQSVQHPLDSGILALKKNSAERSNVKAGSYGRVI
ncbi:MAG: hypothetical protein WB555_27000, partial [Candidatus Korobacteraceae bacterium]